MQQFSYQSVEQIGHVASIGLVVLSTDEVLEYELRHWLAGTGVALYVTRVPMGVLNTPQSLSDMQHHITHAVSLLPPEVDYDVIAYGCTSASAVIGHATVDKLLSEGRTARHFTNPLKALEKFCEQQKLKVLDVVSPYTEASFQLLLSALEKSGHVIEQIGTFNEETDSQVARIAPASVVENVRSLAKTSRSDATFLSCTNLRTQDILVQLMTESGQPVCSSNSVLAWHIAHLCGLPNSPH